MAKILFVEDDGGLADMVVEWLTCERHSVELVADGTSGHERLKFGGYDLAILDWKLPGITGLDICKQHRSEGGKTPIIMLTGNDTITDKETGLDSGADDYLTKPFSVKELSARVRALLRRPPSVSANILTVRSLVLDPTKHRVTIDGTETHLLPKEFSLLEFFMRHPDEIFSSDALLRRVWHSDSEATSEAVRTCLKRLRKKIDNTDNEDEENSFIQTIPRLGYRLKQ
jgi:DNA-binding response OmpR family regulator